MKPNPEYTVTFENLNGGINLAELDYRLPPNESPEMENLLWKNGALNARPGQNYVSDTLLGTPYACHGRKFHGKVISHCGSALYADDVQFYSGVPENAGTFFEYLGNLYYKNKGAYLKISAGEVNPSVSCADSSPYQREPHRAFLESGKAAITAEGFRQGPLS